MLKPFKKRSAALSFVNCEQLKSNQSWTAEKEKYLRGAFEKKNEKSWSFEPKTKYAMQLAINVMKHTLHKWGGNISTIHNVIEGGFQSQP